MNWRVRRKGHRVTESGFRKNTPISNPTCINSGAGVYPPPAEGKDKKDMNTRRPPTPMGAYSDQIVFRLAWEIWIDCQRAETLAQRSAQP